MTEPFDQRGLPPLGPLAALQFLTRVPVRLHSAPDVARAVPWFPVVGGLVGAVCGGVAAGGQNLVPSPVAAALAVVVGLAITGAFHEDGLADTFDAMGGSTPERRREILKDSRHGSYGVAAMCSTIVVRVLCVASLGPAAAFAGLVAAHTLGRGAAVAAMRSPMPGTGLGAEYARAVPGRRTTGALAVSFGVAVLVSGWWTGPFVLAAAASAAAMVALACRAFGGVNGDVLGATEQVVECAVLVVASGLAARHAPWWA